MCQSGQFEGKNENLNIKLSSNEILKWPGIYDIDLSVQAEISAINILEFANTAFVNSIFSLNFQIVTLVCCKNYEAVSEKNAK